MEKLIVFATIFVAFLAVGGARAPPRATVDPKLDFPPSDEPDVFAEKELRGRPNIRGVRVTVEATSESKGSPESRSNSEEESSESSASSSDERTPASSTVGVRTDVTFELSAETNDTRTKPDKSKPKDGSKNKDVPMDDDASVPVIKGRPATKSTTTTTTTYRPMTTPSTRSPPFSRVFPHSDGTIRAHRYGSDGWFKYYPSSANGWNTEWNRWRAVGDVSKSAEVHQILRHRTPYTINGHGRSCHCRLIQPTYRDFESRVDDKLDWNLKSAFY